MYIKREEGRSGDEEKENPFHARDPKSKNFWARDGYIHQVYKCVMCV